MKSIKVLIIFISCFIGLALSMQSIDKIFPGKQIFGAQVTNNVQGNSIDFSKIVDSATLDANFSVASASFNTTWQGNFFLPNAFIQGSTTASGSLIYQGEFVSTGTVSLNLGGTSTNKGTCLQLRNSSGAPVYLRITGTNTVTVNQIKCHP